MSDETSYKVWVRKGGMMVRADALGPHEEGSIYQQIKEQGKNPEDYGIYSDALFDKQSLVDFLSEVQTGHISCRAGANILMQQIKEHIEKKLMDASMYY